MLQLTAQMRLLVAVSPVDFRRGIDGLCRLCREQLSSDPFSGTVFVFRNQRATSVKILVYDGQGFWLCQKRLSQGHFRHWPTGRGEVQRDCSRTSLRCCLPAEIPSAPTRLRSGGVWVTSQVRALRKRG
jgi:transposase